MKYPLISIITTVYNAKSTLEATIKSVLNQDEALFEYWIIDGGSTDGSIDIIRNYQSQLAGWISESDRGIYDAMNKGIDRAQGKWLYFLGADDTLIANVLNKVKTYLVSDKILLYGDVISNTGRLIPSFFSSRTIMQNTIHHQGAFYNKSLFTDFRYNNQLRILSDYELNLKIYINNFPAKKLPMIIACCQEGGASSNTATTLQETNFVRASYVSNKNVNKIWSVLLRTYYLQKQIRAFFIGKTIL